MRTAWTCCGLALALQVASPSAGFAQDLGAELEAAVQLLAAGESEVAASRLAPLSREAGEFGLAARYNFAKSLYRLGFHHAALSELTEVLAAGPSSRYYRAALEWSLYLGRKMTDDVAVNAVLARYGGDALPERNRDEFLFRRARYHYGRALVADRAQAVPEPPPPPPDDDDGISFEEDLFGDGAAEEEGEEDEEGISFGGDLFGEEPAVEAPAKEEPLPSASEAELSAAEHREVAERLVLRVDPSSPYHLRAKFLQGLLRVRAGRDNDALGAFKEVVEGTKEGGEQLSEAQRRRRARLRELAFFQLARLHFGARQPTFSIFYYRKVDRDSRQWLDALYEESWAEYRLGRHERALGDLLTVNAPLFEDAYYPEARILEAVIYYENCRYQEASRIIDTFLLEYEPVLASLQELASSSRSPSEWYELLAQLEGDDEAERAVRQVLEIALADPELERLSASIREVEAEKSELSVAAAQSPFQGQPVFQALVQGLETERQGLLGAAGRAVERKLRAEADAVKTLVGQALRVQVETARAEEGRLEARLTRRQQRPKQVGREVENYTDDEKVVWPFEGEYWRDELGTYELTLGRTCL